MRRQVYRADSPVAVHVAAFRSAVREWLDGHDLTPPAYAGQSIDTELAQLSRVRAALYEAGWMRYGWPESVGGLGGPVLLRAVLGEEVATRDLAQPAAVVGRTSVG